jgi:hypothetical protein
MNLQLKIDYVRQACHEMKSSQDLRVGTIFDALKEAIGRRERRNDMIVQDCREIMIRRKE